jgi:hypothetical protein
MRKGLINVDSASSVTTMIGVFRGANREMLLRKFISRLSIVRFYSFSKPFLVYLWFLRVFCNRISLGWVR